MHSLQASKSRTSTLCSPTSLIGSKRDRHSEIRDRVCDTQESWQEFGRRPLMGGIIVLRIGRAILRWMVQVQPRSTDGLHDANAVHIKYQ